MHYDLILTQKFKKGIKRAIKRGLDISLLDGVVTKLQDDETLPENNKDHALKGKFKGFRECHIQPDCLLIYLKTEETVTLTLVDTGTHADLLEK